MQITSGGSYIASFNTKMDRSTYSYSYTILSAAERLSRVELKSGRTADVNLSLQVVGGVYRK